MEAPRAKPDYDIDATVVRNDTWSSATIGGTARIGGRWGA